MCVHSSRDLTLESARRRRRSTTIARADCPMQNVPKRASPREDGELLLARAHLHLRGNPRRVQRRALGLGRLELRARAGERAFLAEWRPAGGAERFRGVAVFRRARSLVAAGVTRGDWGWRSVSAPRHHRSPPGLDRSLTSASGASVCVCATRSPCSRRRASRSLIVESSSSRAAVTR